MRRCIGLDVHREFAQVAIWEQGVIHQAGRVETTPEALRLFAESLAPSDEVALEATCNTYAIATLLDRYVARVVVSNLGHPPGGQRVVVGDRGPRRQRLAGQPRDEVLLDLAVDLELAGNCRQPPDAATVLGELDAFIRSTEAEWGRQLVLYVGNDFEYVGNDFERRYAIRDRLGRPLWHRRFLRRPDVERWVIWQLHGYARVGGVAGGVDLDVGRAIPSP